MLYLTEFLNCLKYMSNGTNDTAYWVDFLCPFNLLNGLLRLAQ